LLKDKNAETYLIFTNPLFKSEYSWTRFKRSLGDNQQMSIITVSNNPIQWDLDILTTMICPDIETLHVLAFIAMVQHYITLLNLYVSLSVIPVNETPAYLVIWDQKWEIILFVKSVNSL